MWMQCVAFKLTLQMKLIFAFSFIIILNIAVSLYYTKQVHEMTIFQQAIQDEYYNINSLQEVYKAVDYNLYEYIKRPEEKLELEYQAVKKEADYRISKLTNVRDEANVWYMIHAIENATVSLFQEYDQTIALISAKKPDYYTSYYQGQKISKYIPGYINEYLSLLLSEHAREAETLREKIEQAGLYSRLLIICSGLFCLGFTGFFSNWLTKPIRALSVAAKRISTGDYDFVDVPVERKDEIGTLTEIFNTMKNEIFRAIDQLNQKEELERKLHEEEFKNIKMEELLKEAQYLALQSQINPHFLFNTLNVIARAVPREEPRVTVSLIRNLSDLFRFNLSHLNNYTTLKEELDIVEKYIYIQKYRFRERVNYEVRVPEHFLSYMIPSMLLQPLVENSIIHGIENLKDGGRILIDAVEQKNTLVIRVFDNGVGITKDVIHKIHDGVMQDHTGHTTGIGLANIISRIKLMGGQVKIYSSASRGTIIQLMIPQ